ncbi:PREDICTED: serine/threonine-protein kinase-like protein CCR2 [Tarenaya hassleriana]|uniref:serine/threonine-protein kinase-like protein CCR2 n=1 Tax=Tarenaya hassleriana TaxID=28532 RepID=UPI00053C0E5A|nr:PREDICTED: serine/threonine-protein kinase-like protein CCR2 [Tarenaya hassleriana]
MPPKFIIFLVTSSVIIVSVSGYGSTGTIAAAFGENGFFCAIDAGGKQEVICWDRGNNNGSVNQSSGTRIVSDYVPAMASLSGGEGFLCGITSNSSQAFCWNLINPFVNLVPGAFQFNSYSRIAAGRNHVCAISGLYYSGPDSGPVHCWEYVGRVGDKNFTSGVLWNSSFRDPYIDSLIFKRIVSGDGFSCGVTKDDDFVCWGPRSNLLGVSNKSIDELDILASGKSSICGVSKESGQLQCFGDETEFGVLPERPRFITVSAGSGHYCGIREDDHGVDCWGRNLNSSSVPNSSGFVAISSSDDTTCGVRELDLVLDCWGIHDYSRPEYSPPLELCSPGLCSPHSCSDGWFAFNASILKEPELTSLCSFHDLKICLPCGTDCLEGYFPSSTCSSDSDRVCTPCSLCQNSSCWNICKLPHPSRAKSREHERKEMRKLVIIIGCSVLGFVMFLIGLSLVPKMTKGKRDEERSKMTCCFCVSKPVVEAEPDPIPQLAIPMAVSLGETKIFRLSELKDATHGFKEFNELGRGSFGFVYKAVLSDGRQVAVKRANAATIIHSNNRDFEAELEVLCKIRHNNIVNLLGYCSEMGERLLIYEYMPHGTLHDHLHGDLSPLDWSMRLKIALQAAKGLEYLHNEVDPPVVHRDVKTSNILLDSEMCARIADFGLLSSNEKDSTDGDTEDDVYDFGVVLLEILSGRKAYDRESNPPGIAEWAIPLIRKGKAAAIIDKNAALPRNVEPLLKLADLAELAARENPSERPSMRNLVSFLDLIAKSGLTF